MTRRMMEAITINWAGRAADANARSLREAFAGLMDSGAAALQKTGFDLDDVVMERVAVMRDAGDPFETHWLVPLPFLACPADWLGAFDAVRVEAGAAPARPSSVEFTGLRLEIFRDEANVPPPGGISAEPSRIPAQEGDGPI